MEVKLHRDFKNELKGFSLPIRRGFTRVAIMLKQHGRNLGYPYASSLKYTKHDVRQLRIDVDTSTWRAFFVFDESDNAIVLAMGQKAWITHDYMNVYRPQRLFYKSMMDKAEKRLENYRQDDSAVVRFAI